MADCYIREFVHAWSEDGTHAPDVLPEPALAQQKIAIGATTQSNAFNARTGAILLVADGACHYDIGTNPVASSTTGFLPANTFLTLCVPPSYKIAIAT